jgi:Amt family ammonium transporter
LVGGIFGCLAIGFLGTTSVNSAGANGLLHHGGFTLLGKQALAVVAVFTYSFVISWVLGMIIKHTIGFRISQEAEVSGIDLAEHQESGYEFGLASGSFASRLVTAREGADS